MRLKQLTKALLDRIRPGLLTGQSPVAPQRSALIHVIILDGTMSSLEHGVETNAGLTYRLLSRVGAPVSVYYEAGVQWRAWRNAPDVLMGRGINRQIRRAYGYLCSRYRPGDKVVLLGYSRGAFAVRSLGGVIEEVGLLRAHHATERNIRQAYRHYQCAPHGAGGDAFRKAYCHDDAEIEMIGVWDTVKALGTRLPVMWRWAEEKHSFHNDELGASVRHGFQALAINETRQAFDPLIWDSHSRHPGQQIDQVWFKGSHADIGGQVGAMPAARGLSNIPLVWMLENAADCGVPLPEGWKTQFPQDPTAPSIGTWRGWGKLFLLRRARRVGLDPSETVHASVPTEQDETDLQVAG